VSQFTLYGKLSNKKWQPDYKLAMKSIPAEELYGQFLEKLKTDYGDADKIFNGKFGAMMDVQLTNDGPVTIIIESEPKAPVVDEEDAAEGETTTTNEVSSS
jgi:D-tyrosyl-tRNA(Tyr) deacylase